jgi:transposase
MTIVTVGIDLAKNVFAVHCVDATGKPVLLKLNKANSWCTVLARDL